MLRELRRLALGAIEAGAGGGGGGVGDAGVGGFGGLAGECLGERDFGVTGEAFGVGECGLALRQIGRGGGDGGLQRLALGIKAGERLGGVMGERAFAGAVVGDAGGGLGELGEAAAGGLFLGAKGGELVGDLAALVAGGERGGARGGERLGGLRLRGRGLLLEKIGRGHARLGRRRFSLGQIGGGGCFAPAGEDHARLGDADLGGKEAVPFGLTRLATERGGACLLIGNHLVQPQEVRLGGAQFLFGVAAADVEARDAGGFLQHGATVGGLGGDHRADPALADERGGVGAGRGIGEEERHVLGAHILAVDAIGAAGAALDAADDLGLLAVHFGEQRDLGKVAWGAGRGAGEDHVFHAGAAHRFRAVFAHRPAQRLEQVGLAAAVGADDAGQPRLDAQVGGIDEALEARKAKALDLHGRAVLARSAGFVQEDDQLRAATSPRAMTCAWISAAPSKMLRMRASHRMRLISNSSA